MPVLHRQPPRGGAGVLGLQHRLRLLRVFPGGAGPSAPSARSAAGAGSTIAAWMADVGGTMSFDDVVLQLELPARPAFIPQVDGGELEELDVGLEWPAYA